MFTWNDRQKYLSINNNFDGDDDNDDDDDADDNDDSKPSTKYGDLFALSNLPVPRSMHRKLFYINRTISDCK